VEEEIMKTAYELAMERLNQNAPHAQLSKAQKEAIAELDSKYKAKTAEREIFLNAEMAKASAKGDLEALQQLEQQLNSDRKSLRAELEEKKDKIRQAK
jgi:hypothetical protein